MLSAEDASNGKDPETAYDTIAQIPHKSRVVLTSHCSVPQRESKTQGTAVNLPSYDDEDEDEIDAEGDGTKNVKDLRKNAAQVRIESTMTPLLEIKAIMQNTIT